MKRSIFRTVVALSALCAPLALSHAAPPATAPVAPPPSNVVLFPPMIAGAMPDSKGEFKKSARDAQEIITEAIKARLTTAGVGSYVYSRRMPSVQRAVQENIIKAENAANPTDDDRVAQRVAELVGADEYVTVLVDDYVYDDKTHTATFSVSLIRKGADGTQLGTVAEKAVGSAPDDVSPMRQEGSAVAHAADVVAEQTVNQLYPMPKIATKGKKK